MRTFSRDKRYSTRAAQAAKQLGIKLGDNLYSPRSVYGAQQWCVEVWTTADGRVLAISGDKRGFSTSIVGALDMPSTAYDRESEQIEVAQMAGLDRYPETND